MILLVYALNDTKLSASSFKNHLERLPIYLQENVVRYRRWEDAQASLYGKLLIREILMIYEKGVSLTDLKFNRFGRPFINESFDFNISHSGRYVVCVYSNEGKIGVDLEVNKNIDISSFYDIFNEHELNVLKSCSNDSSLFYSWWTMKEAAIKADGRGLSIPLKKVEIIEDNVYIDCTRWHLTRIEIDREYTIHLATDKEVIEPILIKRLTF